MGVGVGKFEVEEREWEWGCDVSYIKRGLGEYNIGARAEAGKSKLPELTKPNLT